MNKEPMEETWIQIHMRREQTDHPAPGTLHLLTRGVYSDMLLDLLSSYEQLAAEVGQGFEVQFTI